MGESTMKVVVFGGGGFVGQNVVRRFLDEGFDVTAADIAANDLPEAVRFVETDITDPQQAARAVEGADYVLHHAVSNLRTGREDPVKNIQVNVWGTTNILEACRKHDVKKIIYSSASSVYGTPEYRPVDEKHPKRPTTVYGTTKYAGEHICEDYNRTYGQDYFVFRFTGVYGPHQHPRTGGLVPMVLSRMLKGEEVTIFGTGSQTRDFVYVGDLSTLILKAVNDDNVKNDVVNAGTGVETSIKEVVDTCAKVLDLTPNIVHKEVEQGERKGFQADMTKCGAILGWVPDTPLEAGLTKTAEWVRTVI